MYFVLGAMTCPRGPAQNRRHLQTHYVYSDDDGTTWSMPIVVEHGLKKEGWHSFWPSPGRGIQLENGRLIVPVTVYDFDKMYAAYLYSDDHGDHWGVSSPIASGLSEAKFAELDNGTIMINSRNATGQGKRAIITSTDQGKTWSKLFYHAELTEPGCNGSFIKVKYQEKNLLIFSNPDHPKERKNMTIRVSFDQGNTWPVRKTIYEGPSAYSCLTVLPDGNIALLYENGDDSPYERISLGEMFPGNGW